MNNNDAKIAEESRKKVSSYIKYKVYSCAAISAFITWIFALILLVFAIALLLGGIVGGRFDCYTIELKQSQLMHSKDANLTYYDIDTIKKYQDNVNWHFLLIYRAFLAIVLLILYVVVVYFIMDIWDHNSKFYKNRFKGTIITQK